MKTLHTTCDFGELPSGRLDRIVQQLTGLSRAGVRGLFGHGCVSVNGAVCTDPAASARQGDEVQVTYDPHCRYREPVKVWRHPAFEILFEDEHLLVVNKAAHVLTVPTTKRQTNTLVHALERYLQAQPHARSRGRGKGQRGRLRPWVVHRLDLGVSGVIVFAKSRSIAERLKDQFAQRKPQREYIAIVNGEIEARQGTFTSHLATDASLNRYSTPDQDKGELAITHYEVDRHIHGSTLVKVRLETGRRNQIRVHFAEAGHPVLGDPRYPRAEGRDQRSEVRSQKSEVRGQKLEIRGQRSEVRSQKSEIGSPATDGNDWRGGAAASPSTSRTSRHPRWRSKRMALHAVTLGFRHPVTGKPLRFQAALPDEFATFVGSPSATNKPQMNTDKHR